jgi:hypothetical protein
MDFIGITFDGELQDYVRVKSIKVNKWVSHKDLSLDVTFRISIEHKYGEKGFKKIKKAYVYFLEEDFEDIIIDKKILEKEREILKKSKLAESEERKVQEKISPMEGYIPPILANRIVKEDDGEKKRIEVDFEKYDISENTRNRRIYFPLKFRKSIYFPSKFRKSIYFPSKFKKSFPFFGKKNQSREAPWYYDCIIGPHSIQILKWNQEEFMPTVEQLEVWLQIPQELYGSLSTLNIQPVDKFKQMFLLEEEMAEKFKKMGQPLAQKDTLCINWSFSNIGISSSEEIQVTCRLREFKVESSFIDQFEKHPEDIILVLRELLYRCKRETIDFTKIISGISNKTLEKVLEIFNVMIFRKGLRSMGKNLEMLLPLLKKFKGLPHGEEFYNRYDIFKALLTCQKTEDFLSEPTLSKINRIKNFDYYLDSHYAELMQDLSDLTDLTKKFSLYNEDEDKLRYKTEILEKIDDLDEKWEKKLMHPDSVIFYKILTGWKNTIEREYEEQVPKPSIEAVIKTKCLAFADKVGVILSVKNIGNGKATKVYAQLLEKDNYNVIKKRSEIKTHLGREREFNPELIISPKNEGEIIISYEIYYSDPLGKENKKQFKEPIRIIRREMSFQKIENPYIVGDIVRERKMFFGREKLMEDIFDAIKGRHQINPIFLYGQRRTGKSSALYHLKNRFKNGFVPVLFDMSQFFGNKSFYQDLMEEIRKEIDIVDEDLPEIKEDPFDEFMEKFYSKIKSKLNGKKIILMIDEYQRIDTFIAEGVYDESVIDFLDTLVQGGEIKVILAGFLQAEELQSKKWIEFMRLFQTKNVSFLEREDALALIREPVKEYMVYDDGAIEKIISLSACHPYFIQLICHTMVEYHNHSQISLIKYETVIDHLFDYLEKGHNVFIDIISAQTKELEQQILFRMHESMKEKKVICVHQSEIELSLLEQCGDIGKSKIEEALSLLERKEIIQKTVEHPEYYEFTVDLYRQWIKWNISPS